MVCQFFICFLLSLGMFLLRPVSWLFGILIYAVYPLVSLISAMVIVRKGINPYGAWLLPAVSETLSGLIASMGYAPDILPILISAFLSLIGAATGDVMNKQDKRH